MGDMGKQVASSIQGQLKKLTPISSNCCIYRVPEYLRKVNEDAYRPSLVSIGPYYYKDQKLASMKEQKLRYLQSFLGRNSSHNIDHYAEALRGCEQAVRQCYVTEVDLPSLTFIEMVLVDAFFIIELFSRAWYIEYVDGNDRLFKRPRLIVEVTRDLRIEENQLPFFVLKGLYDEVFASSPGQPSFMDLTYKFFMRNGGVVPERISNSDVKHFVDFLRLCHLPPNLRGISIVDNPKLEFSLSVTQLNEAGVKFVVRHTNDLLDLNFSNGVLEIPRLVVTDDTESLFRNIMVFEQCHYYSDSYIVDYFAFLNSLINTPKDVETLVQSGIIENWLGSNEEVAAFFNNIFKQTRLRGENFYYSGLSRALNKYANIPWNKWKAILKHDYFYHPWAVISVVYAIVMLVLTVLQAVSGFT